MNSRMADVMAGNIARPTTGLRPSGFSSIFTAMPCGCEHACTIHGHAHGQALTATVPVADDKAFWGALGCSCWAF